MAFEKPRQPSFSQKSLKCADQAKKLTKTLPGSVCIDTLVKPKGVDWDQKLYKIRIYNKGSKFASHVDTLHAENHVATLLMGLL